MGYWTPEWEVHHWHGVPFTNDNRFLLKHMRQTWKTLKIQCHSVLSEGQNPWKESETSTIDGALRASVGFPLIVHSALDGLHLYSFHPIALPWPLIEPFAFIQQWVAAAMQGTLPSPINLQAPHQLGHNWPSFKMPLVVLPCCTN